MKILVCGGRHYNDSEAINKTLDRLKPSMIIEGGSTGADWHARLWAIDRGVPYETIFAEWEKFSRLARPMRNARLIAAGPDLVVAFPGGKDTAEIVQRAKASKINVLQPC